MSTKIYDAYAFTETKPGDALELMGILKRKCYDMATESLTKTIATMCSNFIDTANIYKRYPETGRLMYDDIAKYVADLYRKSDDGIPNLIHQNTCRHDDDKILSYMTRYGHLNIKHVFTDIIENEAAKSQALKHASPWHVHNRLSLFPHGKSGRILCIASGMQVTRLMSEIAHPGNMDTKDVREAYGIRDYHYQNQVDRPENISELEWETRRNDWDEVMPTGMLSDGTVVTLTTADTVCGDFFFLKPKDILRYVGHRKGRIDHLARAFAELKNVPEAADAVGTIRSHRETKKSIRDREGKGYRDYLAFIEEFETCVPTITAEMLEMKFTDLLPELRRETENE